MSRPHYVARARRQGEWWVITVEGQAVVSQARRLQDIEPMAREAISLHTDMEPDAFEVAVVPELPANMGELVERAKAARAALAEAQAASTATMAAAAAALIEAGLTTREAAELVGVSFQRVSQLVRGQRAS